MAVPHGRNHFLIIAVYVPYVVSVRESFRIVLKREHLVRTMMITVVVGSWLTLFNVGDVLLAEGIDWHVAGKVVLNYLTPFVVANLGLLSHS